MYRAEIAREKAERSRGLANDVVSRAADAVKAVPVPKAPGRER
jgi:hypothetical protein